MHLGAGQLVTLAVGTNQRLYLWYFSNGSWGNPRQMSTSFAINQIFFGPLSVSSWGEGSIDLGLVDAQTGALYHDRLGGVDVTGVSFSYAMTPGRAFASLGGTLSDTPVLTAISPTRISILAMGTDHAVYSNWSSRDPFHTVVGNQAPPMVWSDYHYLGAKDILLGGVAKTGANELTAAGIDTSGRVLLSRYCGATWIQFEPVIGQDPQTLLSLRRFRPAVTNFHS